ncbi:MAG TPA: DUF885 domain-containing protein [Patescibacteria group bacterium]|nr:DUF885 domain-containing protein [Patescibacteria group bacterium]
MTDLSAPDPRLPGRPEGDPDAASRLAELAAEAWDGTMATQPEYATALGDRRFDERLRPNGPDALEREIERIEFLQERAAAIDPGQLSADDRVTRAALLDVLGTELDLAASGIEAWAVDPLDGPQVQFLNIPSFQPVASEADGSALLGRWREMGPWVDRRIETTRSALATGVGAPQALVRRVVAELDDLLGRPVTTWPLLDPARNVPAAWPGGLRDRYASDVETAVVDGFRPALERYRAFLVDEVGPVARGDDRPGLGALPGGDESYARVVRAHSTLGLTPPEIHRIGLEETERIDDEFRALGDRVLGTAALADVLARLRSDPALHFVGPAEVMAAAEESLARANTAIGAWFGRLPRTSCVVVAMAEHEAQHSTIAYYRQPAADGSRPGTYFVNTSEPTTRPRYEAEVLAFHEAVPGHHLQIAIAQELDGLPAFRRLAGPTAYVEGWALYSERLSEEMGLLSGEMDRFGILSFDAWRACRLVVDTGLHALGWSRDAAIRFMVEHTALAENNIANEVDRYLAMPGQALAYKLGQREILALRDQARSGLGDRFDIRTFHDVVLGQGAVGLGTLRGVVETWIAGQRH